MSEEQDWKDALEVRQKFLSLVYSLEEFMRPYQANYQAKGDFELLYQQLQRAIQITQFNIKMCEQNIEYAKQREHNGN